MSADNIVALRAKKRALQIRMNCMQKQLHKINETFINELYQHIDILESILAKYWLLVLAKAHTPHKSARQTAFHFFRVPATYLPILHHKFGYLPNQCFFIIPCGIILEPADLQTLDEYKIDIIYS